MELSRKFQIRDHFSAHLSKTLTQKMLLFLSRQDNHFSLFFFSSYFLSYYIEPHIDNITNQLIFLLFLLSTFVTNINFYYYYIALINLDSFHCMVISLVLGIMSINHISKIYLFILSLSFYFKDAFPKMMSAYQVLVSAIICWQVYKHLFYNSQNQNKKFYVGSSLILLINAISLLEQLFQFQTNFIIEIILITILEALFYYLICNRIEKVKSQNITKIKSPYVALFKIQKLTNDTSKSLSQIKEHLHLCNRLNCFCHQFMSKAFEKNLQKIEFGHSEYINYLYLSFLNQQNSPNAEKSEVAQAYSRFLLQINQPIKSIKIMMKSKEQDNDFFGSFTNIRQKEEIYQFLRNKDYYRINRKKYELIYSYDLYNSYLNKQVSNILSEKIIFWAQLCRPQVRIKILEENSSSIIDRMEFLHQFYCKKIKPIEEQVWQFDATVFYAGYMIATTNYIELAGDMLKTVETKISKVEPGNTFAQVTGIELALQDQSFSDSLAKTSMVIKNISLKLATSLKKKKHELLNQKMKTLIPQHYASIHATEFNRWVNSKTVSEDSYIFSKDHQEIPLKISEKQIMFTEFQFRFYLDNLTNEIRLQALFFDDETNSKNFITDINGKVVYQGKGIKKEFLCHEKIAEAVSQMKKEYERNSKTEPMQLSVQLDDNSYYLTLSYMFENYSRKRKEAPLLRIRYEDQNSKFQKLLSGQLRVPLQTIKTQLIDQNESLTSMKSQNNATESIMSIIDQKKYDSKKLLGMKIFFVFAVILLYSLFFMEKYTLTTNNNSKPLYTELAMFRIMISLNIATTINQDLQLYDRGNPEFIRLMNKVVLEQNYKLIKYEKIHEMANISRQIMIKELIGQTDYMNLWRNQAYSRLINVTLYNADQEYQMTQLKFQQILIRMINQLQYFQKHIFQKTLFSTFLSEPFLIILMGMGQETSQVIEGKFQVDKTGNILMASGLFLVIITINIVYVKLLKSEKEDHIDIYSLLSHLNAREIYQEVLLLTNFKEKTSINIRNNIYNHGQQIKKKQPQKQNRQKIGNLNNQKNVKNFLRTRPGDLILENSQLETRYPSKIERIFLIYSLFLIFLLILMLVFKISCFNYAIITKNEIILGSTQILGDLALLHAAKLYYDIYEVQSPIFIFGQDLEQSIRDRIFRQYQADFLPNMNAQEQIAISDCMFNNLICAQAHSYAILRGLVKRAVYDSFNAKLQKVTADRQNVTYTPTVNPKMMRSQLFLAQQAVEREFFIAKEFMENSFKRLAVYEQEIEDKMYNVLQIFCGLMFFFGWYLGWIIKKKTEKYTKSIKVLSFMKKEMIYQNKRVQSFVNKLAKHVK